LGALWLFVEIKKEILFSEISHQEEYLLYLSCFFGAEFGWTDSFIYVTPLCLIFETVREVNNSPAVASLGRTVF
jgi:hypothetical protein